MSKNTHSIILFIGLSWAFAMVAATLIGGLGVLVELLSGFML